jgi:hypothetical protein
MSSTRRWRSTLRQRIGVRFCRFRHVKGGVLDKIWQCHRVKWGAGPVQLGRAQLNVMTLLPLHLLDTFANATTSTTISVVNARMTLDVSREP